MSKVKWLLAISGLLCLSACSKVEELDKRTKTMADTTTEMSDTTKKMAETTDEMNDVTSHMYPQIRTKETEDTRNKKMQLILDKQSGMGARIAASAIYFQSFEFQFWNNNKTYDTPEVRERLFVDAANEFFRRATDIYNRIDVEKLSPTLDDPEGRSNEMAFLALSVAMHMVNHHQEQIHKDTKQTFEIKSFYDLMKSALIKDKLGQELTESEAIFVTGTNKEISIQLLKARSNMLLALAVSYMIDLREIDQASLSEKGSALLAKLSNGKFGKVKLHSLFEKSNMSTKKEILKRLEASKSTLALLNQIGQAIKWDPTIQNIVSNLVFDDNATELKNPVQLFHYKQYRSLLQQLGK